MGKRLDNVSRLLQVQVQLRRDAESRLARAAAEERRLAEEEIRMVEAMSRDDAPGFALARTGGSVLRKILIQQQRANVEHAACEQRYKEAATRAACIERLHVTVQREQRQHDEKKMLEELLDQEWARVTSLK
ncbi:MAG: hypothetical protein K2X62_15905 [Beijerinckiaceae bacterium]|jgi:hypothetical protein|nr:hypothetical protein [Beijerinckiaceae bacterium]MDO9440549.1 hypothetical protein [Beijerinckiaceae bacterium]